MGTRQDALFDAFPGGEGVSLDDQIAAIEEEIWVRRRVNAAGIRRGTLHEDTCTRRLAPFLAVRRSLVALRATKAAMR